MINGKFNERFVDSLWKFVVESIEVVSEEVDLGKKS
jgi:hypothetical protein